MNERGPNTRSGRDTANEPNAEVLADAYRYILACGEKRRERDSERRNMSWEVFDRERNGRVARSRGEPRVRTAQYGKGYAFVLNSAATDLLNNATQLTLLFDEGEGLVGLRPTLDDDHTLRFADSGRGVRAGGQISATRFFRHYGIEPKRGYPAHAEGDMLVFGPVERGTGQ